MISKETIGILGCGWLGLPLAVSLISKGAKVKGSTTTLEKLQRLAQVGIEPYIVRLATDKAEGDLNNFLEGVDILIINIPPQDKTGKKPQYLKSLIGAILLADIRKIIFVSSTRVFQDTAEFPSYGDSPLVKGTEGPEDVLLPESIFQSLREFYDMKTSIVRFGGLIGPDRHPIHHLAGRAGIANPEAPINLIDQKDCIGILESIVEYNAFGIDFNAVHPDHPSRKEYYTSKAKELGLPLPQFKSGPSFGKRVASVNVKKLLGYEFQRSL